MGTNAISIQSLEKSFADEQVLHGIDLEIEDGEFCVILGPSGCGKSTLLKCIAGLHAYDGRIHLDGVDAEDVAIEDRSIGFVFQEFEETLFPHMTVEKNIAFGLEQQGVPADEIGRRVDDILALLAISETRENYPNQLSGGQQQRVELARQIIRRCDLMLFDDPLADLDYKLQKKMELEVRRLHDDLGSTFVYVTHNQDQALKLADKLIVMNHGRIEQIGTPMTVYENPKTVFVGRFVGDSNVLAADSVEPAADGTVVVETAVGSISARAPPEPIEGTAGPVVLIRPEAVAIGTAAESKENQLTGTIEGRTYTGEYTEFSVAIPELSESFQVTNPGNVTTGRAGQDVSIGWDSRDARYLETLSVVDSVTLDDFEEF